MAVMFTGHRDVKTEDIDTLCDFLFKEIAKAYEEGERVFYVGMALGFDLMAMSILQQMRDSDEYHKMFQGIHVVAVVPFSGQADRWSDGYRVLWRELCDSADEQVVLQNNYSRDVFLRRNDYMLEKSHRVIAYYDGRVRSGTGYTVRKALKNGVNVVNYCH